MWDLEFRSQGGFGGFREGLVGFIVCLLVDSRN